MILNKKIAFYFILAATPLIKAALKFENSDTEKKNSRPLNLTKFGSKKQKFEKKCTRVINLSLLYFFKSAFEKSKLLKFVIFVPLIFFELWEYGCFDWSKKPKFGQVGTKGLNQKYCPRLFYRNFLHFLILFHVVCRRTLEIQSIRLYVDRPFVDTFLASWKCNKRPISEDSEFLKGEQNLIRILFNNRILIQ